VVKNQKVINGGRICAKSRTNTCIALVNSAIPQANAHIRRKTGRTSAKDKEKRVQATGDGAYYRIEKLSLAGAQNDISPEFAMGEDLDIELQIYSPDDRPPVGVVGVVRADGTPVYGVVSDNEGITPVKLSDQHYRYRLRFTSINILPGSYSLRGFSMDPEGVRVFDRCEMTFTVTGNTKESGYVRLPHKWLD